MGFGVKGAGTLTVTGQGAPGTQMVLTLGDVLNYAACGAGGGV